MSTSSGEITFRVPAARERTSFAYDNASFSHDNAESTPSSVTQSVTPSVTGSVRRRLPAVPIQQGSASASVGRRILPVRTKGESHVDEYVPSNSGSSSSEETSDADNSQTHASADSEDASDVEHRDYRRLYTERRVTSQGREGRFDGCEDHCLSESREETEARVRITKSTEIKQTTTDRCSNEGCTEKEYRTKDNLPVQGEKGQPRRYKGEGGKSAVGSTSETRRVSFGEEAGQHARRTGDDRCNPGNEYSTQDEWRHRSTNDHSFRTPTLVKLGQYRGDTCLETFLAKFEKSSGYLHWNEADRLFHLRVSLEGPAGQILWDAGLQTSVDVMIRLLRARFGTDHQAERFRAELRGRRRKKGESF
jgi:hypothetical protein